MYFITLKLQKKYLQFIEYRYLKFSKYISFLSVYILCIFNFWVRSLENVKFDKYSNYIIFYIYLTI